MYIINNHAMTRFFLHVNGAKGLKEYEDACGPIMDCGSLILKNELEDQYVIIFNVPDGYSITRGYVSPHVFVEPMFADFLILFNKDAYSNFYIDDIKFDIVDYEMSENLNRVTRCDVQWRIIRHNGITKLKPETSECCVTACTNKTTEIGCNSHIEVQDAHLMACCEIHGKCKIDQQMSKRIREVLNPGCVYVLYLVVYPGLYVKFGNSCLHNAQRRQNTYGPTRNHTFLWYNQDVVRAQGYRCLDNYINYEVLRKGSSSPLVTFVNNSDWFTATEYQACMMKRCIRKFNRESKISVSKNSDLEFISYCIIRIFGYG
jgi:hypothetical protein